jgi:hypothetical protein
MRSSSFELFDAGKALFSSRKNVAAGMGSEQIEQQNKRG